MAGEFFLVQFLHSDGAIVMAAILGPVLLTFYSVGLNNATKHDDSPGLLLPHKTPKVDHSVRKGA